MDTSLLEQKIEAIEQEIADDQKKMKLIKENISTNNQALKAYKRGLERLKEKE